MTTRFVHLRVHTEYSLSDGIVRIKPLLQKCNALNMRAVAVTDRCNFFGLVKFFRTACAEKVKPIFGADLAITDAPHKPPYLLTLLCENELGYRNLTKLISRAYLEGQHKGIPLVYRRWLKRDNLEGLIALSGGRFGDVGEAVLLAKTEAVISKIDYWRQLFPNRFYLELNRTQRPEEEKYIQNLLPIAEQLQCPVVATNAVCFLEAEDFDAHEARVCISGGYVLDDPKRPKKYTGDQYLKTPEEMAALFSDIPSAIDNTVEIAKRCNVKLTLGENYLPQYDVPEGMTPADYLVQISEEGLAEKQLDGDHKALYTERLHTELKVINEMGFPGYFLIVADFIRWAKNNDIPVGPGRGSGAGSLVAYVLGITNLDPLAYDLLFERFLNPERVSMPDFDIDFCMDGRDRVIEYVADRYGRSAVSQIITYGTMAAKAVIRDVGRVLGYPYGFVDRIAKLVPFEIGMTLAKALADEPDLKQLYDNDSEVREVIDLARKLEGITRNVGKHAGGVVIAPSELTDFSPLFCESDGAGVVTQFDKDDVEAVGLVKFDFLGLKTLTIIDWAVHAVNRRIDRELHEKIDIDNIPLDDKKTFSLLKNCLTTAIFQLESRGMKDLIRRLRPDSFEEIVALVALFRPGPLQSGMVDDFINRKHGRQAITYPHPDLENILKPTYGVILYQEQVMQIAQVLANYTLGGADLLRRAMGKKKPEEMAKQREIFVSGAKSRGVDEEKATYIFDLMEKFAGYGFNKSHSAAYALVSYQTAWLKAHYPAEFMAAVMSADMHNTDKIVMFIDDCQGMGIKILPPNVNESGFRFKAKESGEIVYGLGAIKGVGEGAIDSLVDARKANGPFSDIYDFCARIDLKRANRRTLEALIAAGALDALGKHRAELSAALESAVRAAEQSGKAASVGQADLFGACTAVVRPEISVAPWPAQEQLAREKASLGLYLSGHPLDAFEDDLKDVVTAPISQIQPKKKQTVVLGGQIMGLRNLSTKRDERMAIVTLADKSGRADVAVYPDAYQVYRDVLQKDALVLVEGEASQDDYTGGIRISASKISLLSEMKTQYLKSIRIQLTATEATSEWLAALKTALAPYMGGDKPMFVDYKHPEFTASLKFPESAYLRVDDACLEALQRLTEPDTMTLSMEY